MPKHHDRLLKNFVVVNVEYYSEMFKKLEKSNHQSCFNFAPFYFGSLWFFYRKMYGIGILLFLSPFLLFFIYVFLFNGMFSSNVDQFFLIFPLILRFGAAYFANTLYWQKWLNYEVEYLYEKSPKKMGVNIALPILVGSMWVIFLYWLLTGMMQGMRHS